MAREDCSYVSATVGPADGHMTSNTAAGAHTHSTCERRKYFGRNDKKQASAKSPIARVLAAVIEDPFCSSHLGARAHDCRPQTAKRKTIRNWQDNKCRRGRCVLHSWWRWFAFAIAKSHRFIRSVAAQSLARVSPVLLYVVEWWRRRQRRWRKTPASMAFQTTRNTRIESERESIPTTFILFLLSYDTNLHKILFVFYLYIFIFYFYECAIYAKNVTFDDVLVSTGRPARGSFSQSVNESQKRCVHVSSIRHNLVSICSSVESKVGISCVHAL